MLSSGETNWPYAMLKVGLPNVLVNRFYLIKIQNGISSTDIQADLYEGHIVEINSFHL